MAASKFRYANDRLTDLHKIAEQLRARGVDRMTTELLMLGFSQTWCYPPVPDDQVEKIVRELFAAANC